MIPVNAAEAKEDPAWARDSLNESLFPSTEPAVVFAALARWATVEFCDACSLALSSGTEGVFRITEQVDVPVAAETLRGARPELDFLAPIHFAVPEEFGHPAYSGVIEFWWHQPASEQGNRVAATAFVDLAISSVRSARLAERVVAAEDRSARLLLELQEARVVGQAIGFLMGRKQFGEREAEEYIRRGSYSASSTTIEFAAALVHGARLEPLNTEKDTRRGRLRAVKY